MQRGQQEGHELDKILFFSPTDCPLPSQLSVIGLSEGLITFTRYLLTVHGSIYHHQSLYHIPCFCNAPSVFIVTSFCRLFHPSTSMSSGTLYWQWSLLMHSVCVNFRSLSAVEWVWTKWLVWVIGRIFSPEAPCQLMQAEQHCHIFLNCEPDIWMVMVIKPIWTVTWTCDLCVSFSWLLGGTLGWICQKFMRKTVFLIQI